MLDAAFEFLKFRGHQLLVALDQLLNVVFGTGWADETMSAGAYRVEKKGSRWGKFWRPKIDALFFWQEKHCEDAYIGEKERRQSPPEER